MKPCVLNNTFMEHLNPTSYCSSLGTAALLMRRMMVAWMGCRGFSGNIMLRVPYVLLLLSCPCPAWQGFTCIYSFILKETRPVFQCRPKSTSNKSKTLKAQTRKARPFYHHLVLCLIKPQAQWQEFKVLLTVLHYPRNLFTSGMTGIQEDLHLEKINNSQKIYRAKPTYVINITDYPN